MKKNYDDFKTSLTKALSKRFTVRTTVVAKTSKNYDAFSLISGEIEENKAIPTFYFENEYDKYIGGKTIRDIVAELSSLTEARMNIDIDMIMNFDEIKDKLIPCPIKKDHCNSDFLSDKPHFDILDLTVIYRIQVSDIGTVVVTNGILDSLGVSVDTLHEAAINNIKPQFKGLSGVIYDLSSGSIDMREKDEVMYVLTSETMFLGAGAILNKPMMDSIFDKMGDFYILPSSIHEVLIVKCDPDNISQLNNMVKEVNRTELSPEEQLSDHIYGYKKYTGLYIPE